MSSLNRTPFAGLVKGNQRESPPIVGAPILTHAHVCIQDLKSQDGRCPFRFSFVLGNIPSEDPPTLGVPTSSHQFKPLKHQFWCSKLHVWFVLWIAQLKRPKPQFELFVFEGTGPRFGDLKGTKGRQLTHFWFGL